LNAAEIETMEKMYDMAYEKIINMSTGLSMNSPLLYIARSSSIKSLIKKTKQNITVIAMLSEMPGGVNFNAIRGLANTCNGIHMMTAFLMSMMAKNVYPINKSQAKNIFYFGCLVKNYNGLYFDDYLLYY
jgi:hypothetical protein